MPQPTAATTFDELVFENADKQAVETGDALLLSEFGATDDLAVIRRNIEQRRGAHDLLAVLALLRLR